MDSANRDLGVCNIKSALRQIVESDEFDASERNRHFLEHIVDEALAGRAERIKAYSIATSVFGRDDSFDAQLDPIVRIEASRLRRSLERYYLTAGKEDRVRISIPKGGYVPTFESVDTGPDLAGTKGAASEPDQPAAALGPGRRYPARILGIGALAAIVVALLAAAWIGRLPPFAESTAKTQVHRHGPAIFVAGFTFEGDAESFPGFAEGLTREIIVGLTRFEHLFVYGPETSLAFSSDGDQQRIVAVYNPDYVLTGGIRLSGDRFSASALLADARSGRYLWSSRFDGDLSTVDIFQARDNVAHEVAGALAQPYGVVYANQLRDIPENPPRNLESYKCVLNFYQYWKSYRRDLFQPVFDCLQHATTSDPDYAEAFAALSLMYSDAHRFGFGEGTVLKDALPRAIAIAQIATDLSPGNARAYQALSSAYWLTNDVDRSLSALRKGLELNPNDTEILSELGARLVMRMHPEEGLPLLRESYERNPAQPSGYRLGLFMDHYINKRYELALSEARKIEMPHVPYGQMAIAVAAAQLGRQSEAKAAIDQVLALDPNIGNYIENYLAARNVHPDLIPSIVNGLRKAGLIVPET